jgi:hypothetical protein
MSKKRLAILFFAIAFSLSAMPVMPGFQAVAASAEYSQAEMGYFLRLMKTLLLSAERFEPIPFFRRYELKMHYGVIPIGGTDVTIMKGAVATAALDDGSGGAGSGGRIAFVDCMALGGTMIVPAAEAPHIRNIVDEGNIGDVKRLLRSEPVSFLRKRRLVMNDAVRADISTGLDMNYYYIVNMSVTEKEAWSKMNDVIMGILRLSEPGMTKY